MQNIQVVDEIVKQTEEIIQNFYQDDETAFVFTADHGMSMIGNHGDGRMSLFRCTLSTADDSGVQILITHVLRSLHGVLACAGHYPTPLRPHTTTTHSPGT
jgi:predicted AlkP superfamily pyrophosphatase or phosphodiesterase